MKVSRSDQTCALGAAIFGAVRPAPACRCPRPGLAGPHPPPHMKHPLPLLLVLLLGSLCACRTTQDGTPRPHGKRLTYEESARLTALPNLAKFDEVWPAEVPLTRVQDAFRVEVNLGDRVIAADTHLFQSLTVVPYANEDDAIDAHGLRVGRGDAVLSTYFPPGEIGISIEHHRPQFRSLSLDHSSIDELREHFKFQDSHVGILVGVERAGAPGVISLNNPQTFEEGRLGEAYAPRIYLRPDYPWYLSRERQLQFRDNIRTMALGFNAVSNFPENYNGGDPLAARTPAEVRIHVRQMIRAIAGDPAARAWFQEPDHKLYCSEFAHVSFSAGLLVPLNEATITELAGAGWWQRFAAQVAAHNAGLPSAFTELNQNPHAALVPLALADESLQPAAAYAPQQEKAASLLAFRPMTMADILEHFLALHLPRSTLGESLAPVQGAAFQRLRPGLLELMAMSELPASDPRRSAVEDLFDRITAVVSTPYRNYGEFRTALEPLLVEARTMTGPRDDSGTGLFVPPHLMHLVAMNRHKGGLLGLDYVGHGIHWSLLTSTERPPPLARRENPHPKYGAPRFR
jgi:hypothetical protein